MNIHTLIIVNCVTVLVVNIHSSWNVLNFQWIGLSINDSVRPSEEKVNELHELVVEYTSISGNSGST